MGRYLYSHTGAVLKMAPPPSTSFNALLLPWRILSLNLRFVSKVNEHVWAEGIHVMCVLPLRVPLFTLTICDALQVENSGGPTTCGSLASLRASTRQAHGVYVYNSSRREASRSHIFHCNQNLLGTQKEGNGILRNTNDQWILRYYFLMQIKHIHWKYVSDVKRKEKIGQSIVPFPLILLSVSQRKSTGGMQNKHSCSCISLLQHFYCSSESNVWATKYKLCNSGDFTYELNALKFAF